MFQNQIKSLLFMVAALSFTTPALALDTFMVGPRAMGMAGANVASVDNTTAQYYNPAAFGFFGKEDLKNDNNNLGRKDWGLDVSASAGYRLNNDFGSYLDQLAQIDFNALANNGVTDETQLQELVKLVGDFAGIDQPGNAISNSVNGGLGTRFGSFGLGVHAYAQTAGQVLALDTANLGLTGSFVADVNGLDLVPIGYTADGTYTYFTPTQASDLAAALEASSGLSAPEALEAVDRLDYVATQEGLDPALAETVATLLNNVSAAGGSLNDNTTTVAVTGFGYMEVPLSYGHRFKDNFAVGINVKLMKGRVYGTEVLVFDDGSGDVLNDVDESYQESTTFGLDLGVMARFSKINLGLVARNINKPTFDGFSKTYTLSNGSTKPTTFADVTLDPQLTAGVAFIPFETLLLEIDYDLLANDTLLQRPGYTYETQNLAVGLEWDVFRALALRLGAYKNMAESEADWNLTGGLGVNLWAMRFDLGAVYSTEKAEYDGEEAPKELQASAMLSVDF